MPFEILNDLLHTAEEFALELEKRREAKAKLVLELPWGDFAKSHGSSVGTVLELQFEGQAKLRPKAATQASKSKKRSHACV